MSTNRAYTAGQQVKVDSNVVGLNPLPTLGTCTINAVVLQDSIQAEWQVYVQPEGYPALLVYKERVEP